MGYLGKRREDNIDRNGRAVKRCVHCGETVFWMWRCVCLAGINRTGQVKRCVVGRFEFVERVKRCVMGRFEFVNEVKRCVMGRFEFVERVKAMCNGPF